MTRDSSNEGNAWTELRKFVTHAARLEVSSRAGRYNLYGILIAGAVTIAYVFLDRQISLRINVIEGFVFETGDSGTPFWAYLLAAFLFTGACMVIVELIDRWHGGMQEPPPERSGPR